MRSSNWAKRTESEQESAFCLRSRASRQEKVAQAAEGNGMDAQDSVRLCFNGSAVYGP